MHDRRRAAPRNPRHHRPAGRRARLHAPCGATAPSPSTTTTTYLHQVEALLRTLAAQGNHTTVALFDPEEYAEFCADTGLDPDTPSAAPASPPNSPPRGAAVPYDGPAPRRASSRTSSTRPSARPPGSTPPRSSPSSATAPTAARTSAAPPSTGPPTLLDAHPRHGAGPGKHHLVCSVPAAARTLVAVLHADATADGARPARRVRRPWSSSPSSPLGIATRSPGGLVMRTTAPDTPDRVHGWRLHRGRPRPPHRGRGLQRLLHRRRHPATSSPRSPASTTAPGPTSDDTGRRPGSGRPLTERGEGRPTAQAERPSTTDRVTAAELLAGQHRLRGAARLLGACPPHARRPRHARTAPACTSPASPAHTESTPHPSTAR